MSEYNSLPKTTFATDAFYTTLLGERVAFTINVLGRAYYKVHQVDMYNVILENDETQFLLVAKSAIVSVEAPESVQKALTDQIAAGVTLIEYKASVKRMGQHKGGKPANKPFVRPQHTERTVAVTVKPKRTY